MGLLRYQSWKSELVEAGICRQTIRARRRRPIRVGERLFHYRGLRTPQASRLRPHEQDFCQQTFPIELRAVKDAGTGTVTPVWCVNGKLLKTEDPELLDIATRDGFKSPDEMTAWFLKNHPPSTSEEDRLFFGDVIRW